MNPTTFSGIRAKPLLFFIYQNTIIVSFSLSVYEFEDTISGTKRHTSGFCFASTISAAANRITPLKRDCKHI